MVEKPLIYQTNLRHNLDIKKMIEWILELFPDRFESESHLIRCAIIELYTKLKQEVKNES